jgi:exopolyphosphatase/guanosine-5'-triphosphate,3'-diphosphate pyrophosphatase
LNQPETIAAIDLGSNSFHMIVAHHQNGQLKIIDRVKEMVRLGGGLDKRNNLTAEAMERAIATLERFGQRLNGIPPHAIRCVGTKTLRTARNAEPFLERAQRALDHEIEIISGFEEARLVYQGVTHDIEALDQALLVIDIGGRSTELIRGIGQEPQNMDSLTMGSVSMSMRHFADGTITARRMERAELDTMVELRGVRKQYHQHHWERAIGSSGTIRTIAAIIQAEGWSQNAITLQDLKRLREQTIAMGSIEALSFEGLKEERRPVFPGGLAILYATFKSLQIEEMLVSDGALREGVLYDYIGRISNQDIRELATDSLMKRYHVDVAHAERVHVMASALFNQVASHFQNDEERFENALRWGAKLHEIGLAISHRKYHQHSAYLIENSDIPGFSRQEQRTLSALVRAHRMKLSRRQFDSFQLKSLLLELSVLLRVAVLLQRGRGQKPIPVPRIQLQPGEVQLEFVPGWLQQHPLASHDLKVEQRYLKKIGIRLRY